MRIQWILLLIPLTCSQEKHHSSPPEKSSDFVTDALSFVLRSSWDVIWLGCPALLEVFSSAWTGFKLVTRNFQRLFRSPQTHRAVTTVEPVQPGNFTVAITLLGILEQRALFATTCAELSHELSEADLNVSPLAQSFGPSDFSLAFNSASVALEGKRRVLCWDPWKSGVVTIGAVFAGFLCAILSSKFIKVK